MGYTSGQLGDDGVGFDLGNESSQKSDALSSTSETSRGCEANVPTVCFGGMLE